MKSVADIVTRDNEQKVVVLSAISGTTDNLIKLSSLATEEAMAILEKMRSQYAIYVEELLEKNDLRKNAWKFLEETFHELEEKINTPLPRDEKWFVAHGELMSTWLFNLLMQERGNDSVLVPALDFMRIVEGEPDMPAIRSSVKRCSRSDWGSSYLYHTGIYLSKRRKQY